MPFRLLIVDDHPLAREAIRTVLKFCRGPVPDVVGEAADGAAALEMARRLKPDIVTMDNGLPDMSGLEATYRLKAEMPELAVIVVSMHDEAAYREAAREAGAAAYVDKACLFDEFPACLDRLPLPAQRAALMDGR